MLNRNWWGERRLRSNAANAWCSTWPSHFILLLLFFAIVPTISIVARRLRRWRRSNFLALQVFQILLLRAGFVGWWFGASIAFWRHNSRRRKRWYGKISMWCQLWSCQSWTHSTSFHNSGLILSLSCHQRTSLLLLLYSSNKLLLMSNWHWVRTAGIDSYCCCWLICHHRHETPLILKDGILICTSWKLSWRSKIADKMLVLNLYGVTWVIIPVTWTRNRNRFVWSSASTYSFYKFVILSVRIKILHLTSSSFYSKWLVKKSGNVVEFYHFIFYHINIVKDLLWDPGIAGKQCFVEILQKWTISENFPSGAPAV